MCVTKHDQDKYSRWLLLPVRVYFHYPPPTPARSVDRAVDRAVVRAPPPSPGCPWTAVIDRSIARSLARRRSPAVALVLVVHMYTIINAVSTGRP